MFTADELNLIENVFDGDKEAFLAAHEDGRRQTIKWSDILVTEQVLPELVISPNILAIRILGYPPPSYFTLPHIASLRALIYNYKMGSLTYNDLLKQAGEHIKLIRNADIRDNNKLSYKREIYQLYFECLPEYAERAKDRLTHYLGYLPKLEHSVVAEIMLREAMAENRSYFSEPINIADVRAVTIIKYREVLLSGGKAAADASPVIGGALYNKFCPTEDSILL